MESSVSGPWPDRRRRRKIIILSLAGAAAFLFLLLVWPTPYRYAKNSDRHRISRISGEAQVYDRRKDEWRAAKRGSRNTSGTRGGGSPIGGGSGNDADREDEGWDEGSGTARKARPKGEQWWYKDGDRGGRGGGDGSPIGGSRNSGGGSPIGGDRGDSRNSPIGGD